MSRRKCMQKRNDSRKQIFSQNEELKAIVNHVRNVGTLDGFCFPQPVVRRLPTKHSTSVSLLFAQFPIQCTTKKYGGRTIVQTIPEHFLSIRHISHCCASNCVTLRQGSSSSSSRPRCLFSLSLTMNKWTGYVISQSHPALGQLKIYQHICDVWWGTGWSKETVTSNLFLTGPKI